MTPDILKFIFCCFSVFLLRCMQCRRGLVIRILSVCPSHACIVTKR